MRKHINRLSSASMSWENLASGVYRKLLNHNEETGERTGLFRFVPEEGASPPKVCHYHSVYEELFILSGLMTFDQKTWLGERGYVFHPPYAVHGFNSEVPETTVFLARSPAELDFNFPEDPPELTPYFVDDKVAARPVAYVNPAGEDSWEETVDVSGKSIGRKLLLSEDPQTGESASVLRLHKGVSTKAMPQGYNYCDEGFVLEGCFSAEDGTIWSKGDYWHRHPGKSVPGILVEKEALVFSVSGALVK